MAKKLTWAENLKAVVVLSAISAIILYVAFSARSEGNQRGVIVGLKMSGVFSKSLECRMMVGGADSGKTWDFSVPASNRTQISRWFRVLYEAQHDGRMVNVLYKRVMFTVPPWDADTTYRIEEVE